MQQIQIERTNAEQEGNFGDQIRELKCDAVIDMICFKPESARQLVEALHGQVQCYLQCGTIWIHGHSVHVPTEESQLRNPFGDYGINKNAIESYLLKEAKQAGFQQPFYIQGTSLGLVGSL